MSFIKKIFAVTLTLLFLTISNICWGQEPGKVIVETIDRGMAVLNDPELSREENLNLRRNRLWDVLEPVFDFEEISKRALAQHWKERSPQEKKEFIEIFTDILKGSYIGKSDKYSGQSIVYHRERRDGKRGRVNTTFLTSDNKEITLDFNMISKNGSWKVYDIIIEGVSLVGNYRSQFTGVLRKSPYKELIEKMQEKRHELLLEKPNSSDVTQNNL